MAQVIDEPDFEWIMMDGSHIKVHPYAAAAGNQDMSRTKGGFNTKIHLAVDAHGIIPPKKNSKEQREYDKHLYKIRRLFENGFLYLKHWHGIATRYAKNSNSFIAAVQIRCMMLWAKI